jgi:hypothetical protein
VHGSFRGVIREALGLYYGLAAVALALALGLGIVALVVVKVSEPWQTILEVTLVVAIFLSPLVVLALAWHVALDKRQGEAFALSYSLGLEYSHNDLMGIPKRFANFGMFSGSVESEAWDVLWGRYGGRLATLFNCRHREQRGTASTGGEFSAAVLTCDRPFTNLLIRPETVADRVPGAGGINFESAEFSRNFFVQSPDRKFAYDVISPQVMEYLLANPGWSFELVGYDAMIWTGKLWPTEKFEEALKVLSGFLNRIPDHVWKQLGSKRAVAPAGA